MRATLTIVLALFSAAAPLNAFGSDWVPTLDDGIKQASFTGQAILYVTKWKPGV